MFILLNNIVLKSVTENGYEILTALLVYFSLNFFYKENEIVLPTMMIIRHGTGNCVTSFGDRDCAISTKWSLIGAGNGWRLAAGNNRSHPLTSVNTHIDYLPPLSLSFCLVCSHFWNKQTHTHIRCNILFQSILLYSYCKTIINCTSGTRPLSIWIRTETLFFHRYVFVWTILKLTFFINLLSIVVYNLLNYLSN